MDVFVYGTLTDPERVARVVSEFEFLGDAILDGLHRVDGEYPTLVPGGETAGRILRTPDVEALDAYEGVESGLYVRVSVPWVSEGAGTDDSEDDRRCREARGCRDGRGSVEVYVGDPEALGADAAWPDTGSFPERVRRFVRQEGVAVRRTGTA